MKWHTYHGVVPSPKRWLEIVHIFSSSSTSSHVKLWKVKWHFPFGCHCLTHKLCYTTLKNKKNIGALTHTNFTCTHARMHAHAHTLIFLFACLDCICIELISHEKFHVAIGIVLVFFFSSSFFFATIHTISLKKIYNDLCSNTADKSAAAIVFVFPFFLFNKRLFSHSTIWLSVSIRQWRQWF